MEGKQDVKTTCPHPDTRCVATSASAADSACHAPRPREGPGPGLCWQSAKKRKEIHLKSACAPKKLCFVGCLPLEILFFWACLPLKLVICF